MPRRAAGRATPSSRPSREAPAITETRVFRSGNSDAVRLPARLKLSGSRVRIRVLGRGRLLVETVDKRRWPRGFWDAFGDRAAGLEAPTRQAPDRTRTRALEHLFRDEDR